MILLVIGLGCILCCASLVFQRMKKQRLLLYSTIAALLFFGASLAMFLVAMTVYAEAGVGSFLGQGTIEVSVPGVNEHYSVASHWGPAAGAVVFILALSLLLAATFLVVRKNKRSNEV